MSLDEAIKTRINEYLVERNLNLTQLSIISNLTPSTLFSLMDKDRKHPKIITIKKVCSGLGITLSEFFDRDYFNNDDETYE